jgi:predicted DsbA family dithiol-disulfide isomerase
VGDEAGIKFSFAGKTGHTGSSHRLIQYAGTKSPQLQNRVVDELFKGFFENEHDITDLDFLKEAGIRAGLDAKEVDEWLKSGKGTKEVEEEVLKAKMAGINGVPNFVIDGRFEVGGAQDPLVFIQLFERIKAQEAKEATKGTTQSSI